MKRRRYLSLIEMMMVLTIIGLVGGATFHMGSKVYEAAKARATESKQANLQAALEWVMTTDGLSLDDIKDTSRWPELLAKAPLISDPQDAMKDAWGQPFTLVENDDEEFSVESARLSKYKAANT